MHILRVFCRDVYNSSIRTAGGQKIKIKTKWQTSFGTVGHVGRALEPFGRSDKGSESYSSRSCAARFWGEEMEAVWCSLSPYRCSTFLSSCIAVKKMVPIPYSCVPSFLHFLSPISQSLLVIADESALWKEKIIGSEKSYFKATFLRDFFSFFFFERPFLFEHYLSSS
jgi:hypothetical protein